VFFTYRNTPAANGANRRGLLIQWDVQPATPRCIFNADMGWHLSSANSL